MPLNVRALIVVLFLTTIVFLAIKPTALLFSDSNDFKRRRNAFYVLTCAAFLGSSFWIYAIVAVPTLLIVGYKDKNPAAAYLFLLYVIPPLSVPTPILGMRSLLDFDNQILLSLLIVIPAMWRRRASFPPAADSRLRLVNLIFVAYGILASALYLHILQRNGVPYPSTATEFLRRLVSFTIVAFAPYLLISRSSTTRSAVLDDLSALLIPAIQMSVIALFEATKGWLLYENISTRWDLAASFSSYLMRGNSLRAMASAGHSLALGYILDIAFGIWLALSRFVPSRLTRIGVNTVLLLGLLAAYSRGPWICAVLIYLVFALQRPKALSGLTRAMLGIVAVAVVIALTPLGRKIAAVIPYFGGTIDVENIYYRQRLWDRIWEIFSQSPVFGDQLALTRMQDLRQGQGIVDFVNGYAVELVSRGSVGLCLFFALVLLVLTNTLRASRTLRSSDMPLAMAGASLTSCILGTLFLWAFGGPSDIMLWSILALALGFSRITATDRVGAL